MKQKNIVFSNMNFKDINFDKNDFIYCDPPYLNSVAAYNENKGWTTEDENILLQKLDDHNQNGGKFALSNNLKYQNVQLDKWKEKYNVHYLKNTYNNCNYHKKDRTAADLEILITNY